MLIHNADITGSLLVNGTRFNTGSFSGSFKGTIEGVSATASYVEYTNVANKPTLVSGSSQITYSGLTGIPTGIVSGSSQVTYSGLTGIPSGIVSGSTQIAGLGYATTSSNTFIGNQTITGSVFGTGSLTIDGCIIATGQIVAQTINVQQVTSSIVYSCGSNVFGTSIGNTQQFTGSMFITGSNLNANVGSACFQGSVRGATIQGSTAVCGPLVCGGTVCGGTGVFGNTGAGSFSLSITNNDQSNARIRLTNTGTGGSIFSLTAGNPGASNTGLAIFDENCSATRMYFNSVGNVGIGTTSPDVFSRSYSGRILGISSSGQSAIELNSATGNGVYIDMGANGTRYLGIYSDASSSDISTVGAFPLTLSTNSTARLGFSATGIACFACQVCAPTFVLANGNCITALRSTGGAVIGVLGFSSGSDTLNIKGGASGGALSIRFEDTANPMGGFYNSNFGVGTLAAAYRIDAFCCSSATNTVTPVLRLAHVTSGTAASGLGAGISFFSQRPSGAVNLERAAIYGISGANPDDDGDLAFYTRTDTGAIGVSEKMRITSDGNIGIGTTNPAATLHLCTINTPSVVRVESACDQAGLRLIAGVPGTARASRIDFLNGATCVGRPQWTIINDYNQNGTNDLSFVNCDPTTRVVTITQGGNVVIGNTVASNVGLTIYGTNAATIYQTPNTGTGAGNGFYVGHTSDVSYIWNYNNYPTVFATNNTERLRISSTGIACFTCQVCALGFTIQPDQQYRMNGYNGAFSYITNNAGFNGNYNGVGIFSNATNANTLPAWLLDLGGLDGPSRGIADAFVIARRASGGSWNNYLTINGTGITCFATTVCSPTFVGRLRGRAIVSEVSCALSSASNDVTVYFTSGITIEYDVNDYTVFVYLNGNSAVNSSLRALIPYNYYQSSVTTTNLASYIDSPNGHSALAVAICKLASSNTYCVAVRFAVASGGVTGNVIQLTANGVQQGFS